MIENPYLVHWSDDSDSNTETTATLEEAQAEIDRWLDLRRGEADDGWPLDMTGYIAVIVERVAEEQSEAPEWSSFDRHVDYHREKVPDPRDDRLSAIEAENAGLRAQLAEESAKADVLRGLLSSREDAYQEHATVMDLLTADDVLCRLGFVEAFEVLKARADDALSEPPAPLRLGRGPTVEEVREHAAGEMGLWLLRRPEDAEEMSSWDEELLFVENGVIRVPARYGSVALNPSTYVDAIPLNAARQPCGVGEGT